MKKSFLMIIAFSMVFFVGFTLSIAAEVTAKNASSNAKVKKDEPFIWDLIFSNNKSIVPMISTSPEIALSPYDPFKPKTQMIANQKRYTTGDRVLIQNHIWNAGGPGDCDYYLAFMDLNNPQYIYWYNGREWGGGAAVHQFLTMGVGFDRTDTLIDLRLAFNPPDARYTLASGLAFTGTSNFYEISTVTIELY